MTKLSCALLLDLDDAADFPGNDGHVLGRPFCAYPLMAARGSSHARRVYAMTSSPPVKAVALQYDAVILDPLPGAPSFQHYLSQGHLQIAQDLAKENAELEVLAILLANAPAVTKALVDSAIEALLDRPELDAAMSVAPWERYGPSSIYLEGKDDLLSPAAFSEGPAWHPTGGITVLRPRCLETPFPWLGRKIFPVKTWGPGLIDHLWQLPGLEHWLKKNGIPDISPNMERQPMPKAQLAPKRDRR